MKVFIDPGHGGSNTGTSSPDGSLVEKDVTLELCSQLYNACLDFPWDVEAMLSRWGDNDLSLLTRGEASNSWGADFVLTVHCNNLPGKFADGVRLFHWPGNDWSKQVCEAIAGAFPLPLQDARAVQVAEPGGQQNVLKYHRANAVLVEVCFLDNFLDAAMLKEQRIRDGIVIALMAGIAEARRTRFS